MEKRKRGRPAKPKGINPYDYPSSYHNTLKIVVVKVAVEGAVNKDGTQYYREHERGEYAKVYRSKKLEEVRYKLTINAKEILFHLPDWLEYKRHTVEIPREKYIKAVRISKSGYYEAIADLVNHKILERTIYADVFAVNPEFFFLGNRGRYFKANVEERVFEKKLDSAGDED